MTRLPPSTAGPDSRAAAGSGGWPAEEGYSHAGTGGQREDSQRGKGRPHCSLGPLHHNLLQVAVVREECNRSIDKMAEEIKKLEEVSRNTSPPSSLRAPPLQSTASEPPPLQSTASEPLPPPVYSFRAPPQPTSSEPPPASKPLPPVSSLKAPPPSLQPQSPSPSCTGEQ